MVYRYTGLAAAAVLAFAFLGLNSLLRSTIEGPPWQFVVLAGLALGAVITWTGLTYRMATWAVAAVNVAALVVVSLRIATPETLLFIIPTAETFTVINNQLTQAAAIIRTGIEPVIPVSGLVVIVTALFWAVGAVTAYALVRGRPALALVPGLVMSLQFATMDRSPTTAWRIIGFLLLLAGSILAVSWDQRAATSGRMVHKSGRQPTQKLIGPATAAALAITIFGSVIAVGAMRNRVPYDGVLSWRVPTGLTGEYFGSVSYNPFVGIQQQLVTSTDTPLFRARVSGDVPADHVYFRLLTLHTYGAGQFFADHPEVRPLDADEWEEDGHAFAGATTAVTTDIVIDRLQVTWLPAAYTPTSVLAEDSLTGALRVRPDDGSLLLDGGLSYTDMVYSVTSQIPQPDIEVLATGADGELSALFEAAAADEAAVAPAEVGPVREEPPNVERYLQLPEDLDTGIAQLARQKTAKLDTAFEAGLALESWFRSSDFRYTTQIDPGHGATNLAEWLLDDYADSPYHRAGYCENFATSMAVMARTLGIPSRVVLGFTPGERVGNNTDIVVVRDRNAHAWVELWLPAQGWVRFDPTPRPDQINPATTGDVAAVLGFNPAVYLDQIPLAAVPDPTGSGFRDPADGFGNDLIDRTDFDIPGDGGGISWPDWFTPAVFLLLIGILVLAGIPLIKAYQRRRRMARLEGGDITAAWEQIVTQLTDYGDEPDETLTPRELADHVDPAMRPLAHVYGRAVYGPPSDDAAAQVNTATQSLEQTSYLLADRHTRVERVVAWYRPTSIIPARFRKRTGRP